MLSLFHQLFGEHIELRVVESLASRRGTNAELENIVLQDPGVQRLVSILGAQLESVAMDEQPTPTTE